MLNKKERLEQAIQYESKRMYLHSLQLYISLYEHFPNDKAICLRLANLYYKMGFSSSAEALLEEFKAKKPGVEETTLYLAYLYTQEGKYEKALEELKQISSEKNPIVYFIKGKAFYELQDLEAAKENLKRYLKSDNYNEFANEAYLILAKIMLIQKNPDETLKYVEKLKKSKFNEYEVNFLIGASYFYKYDLNNSLNFLLKAYEISDDNKELCKLIGINYFLLKNYYEASKYLRESIELGLLSDEIFALLAICLLYSGNIEEAKFYFEEVLKSEPNREFIQALLEKLEAIKN